MNAIRWRLVREQMVVQLQERILNFFSLSLWILQPFVFSAVGLLLARAAGHAVPDLVYNVIGGGVMGMWSGIVFTSTYDIGADRRNGTLELIVGSPTSLISVEAIRNLTNVLVGFFSVLLAFVTAVVVFGYELNTINPWGTFVSMLLLLFSMWCIGVFLANFFIWSRISGTFVEYLEMPIAILCGFMYPIRVLPGWVQTISGLVPIRWALEAMNESLLGMTDLTYLGRHWIFSLGLSLAIIGTTVIIQKKVQDMIRVNGEISKI